MEATQHIFADLEDAVVQPKEPAKPDRFLLDELGREMHKLITMCEECSPLLERLEQGLRLMAQTPFTTEGDQRWVDLSQHWIKLRSKLKDRLPHIYSQAIRVRSLYLKLSPDGKSQAETLWGPIKDTSRDKDDAWLLMKEVYPGEILKRFDDIAQKEGIYTTEGEQTWLKAQRSAERKGRNAQSN